jgi:hypothetical protein
MGYDLNTDAVGRDPGSHPQFYCGLHDSSPGGFMPLNASCAEGMSPTRSGGGEPAACI